MRSVRALRAEVHDPVWFLGRQWQLGEHHGEDAASPALGAVHGHRDAHRRSTARRRTTRGSRRPRRSSSRSPTSGGRSGGGSASAARSRRRFPPRAAPTPRCCLAGLAAPYDRLNGGGSTASRCTARGPRWGSPTRCSRPRACLRSSPPTTGSPPSSRTPRRSPRGRCASTSPATTAATSTGTRRRPRDRHRRRRRSPSGRAHELPDPRLVHGAPHPRWWQIEDHRVDPGAVAPHRTHLAAILMIHLTASHGDDWFTAPLACPTGTLRRGHRRCGRGRHGSHDDDAPRRRLVAVPRQRPRTATRC